MVRDNYLVFINIKNVAFRFLDEVEIKETRAEFTRVESDDGVQLIIKEVTSELSGQYTCKLSNECGGAETTAKLTVNCKSLHSSVTTLFKNRF